MRPPVSRSRAAVQHASPRGARTPSTPPSPRASSAYAAARASKAARSASLSCRSYSSRPSSAAASWGSFSGMGRAGRRARSQEGGRAAGSASKLRAARHAAPAPSTTATQRPRTWLPRVRGAGGRSWVQAHAALAAAVEVSAHRVKHARGALGGCIHARRPHVGKQQLWLAGRRALGVGHGPQAQAQVALVVLVLAAADQHQLHQRAAEPGGGRVRQRAQALQRRVAAAVQVPAGRRPRARAQGRVGEGCALLNRRAAAGGNEGGRMQPCPAALLA